MYRICKGEGGYCLLQEAHEKGIKKVKMKKKSSNRNGTAKIKTTS
jgi:hypothetical protein